MDRSVKSICPYSTYPSLCRWVVSNGEDVTLEVQRVNGSQLTVTVSFTTWAEQLVTVNQLTFDPAVAGTHFTATSGTLRFSPGEVRTKFCDSIAPPQFLSHAVRHKLGRSQGRMLEEHVPTGTNTVQL